MHTNDIRALIATMLRGQAVDTMLLTGDDPPTVVETFDFYLGKAQEILESSWSPKNYNPPLGSLTQGRIEDAISTLIVEGYTIVYPDVAKELNLNIGQITSPVDAWRPPQPEAALVPPPST